MIDRDASQGIFFDIEHFKIVNGILTMVPDFIPFERPEHFSFLNLDLDNNIVFLLIEAGVTSSVNKNKKIPATAAAASTGIMIL